jgi:desulfoferrodoxin (superoxide reductase-like protein)
LKKALIRKVTLDVRACECALTHWLRNGTQRKEKITMRKFITLRCLVLTALVLLVGAELAVANKSATELDVPASAQLGDEITITVNVKHNGNNLFHYTNWVYVMVNGTEIKRWKFSRFKKPESENFSREVTYKVVTLPLEVVAEANCNTHGSEGRATATVSPR